MKTQNVAQFSINERFTLSLSDLGKADGFEAMLIDNEHRGDFNKFIELNSSVWRVRTVDSLQEIIDEAKRTSNKIIKDDLLEDNKDLFIQ